MYLRDNGGGITRESLEFWNKNKNSIGKVTHYGGEGPNGTAKILAELGLTLEEARKAMYRKNIHYDVIRGEMIPPLE